MYAGNAVVVNLLMRFPALIPLAIGGAIIVLLVYGMITKRSAR